MAVQAQEIAPVPGGGDGIVWINTLNPVLPDFLKRDNHRYLFSASPEVPANPEWLEAGSGRFDPAWLPAPHGWILVDPPVGESDRWPYQVDNSVPPRPAISGVASGSILDHFPEINLTAPEGMKLSWRLQSLPVEREGTGRRVASTTSGGGRDSGWIPFEGALSNPSEGIGEYHYYLGYRVISRSGLSREELMALDFVVDTVPPAITDVQWTPRQFPEGELPWISAPAFLDIRMDEPGHLILSPDGYARVAETRNGQTRIVLDVPPGTEMKRSIDMFPVDKAGNKGTKVTIAYGVDSLVPTVPELPEVQREENHGTISWKTVPGYVTSFQIVVDPDETVDWQTVSGPVSWSIPDGAMGLIVRYRNQDKAGNMAEGPALFLARQVKAPVPVLASSTGVFHSRESVTVKAAAGQGEIRYVIVSGDGETVLPDAQSPLLPPDGLLFDAPPGESRSSRLLARQFGDTTEPSDVRDILITIDKEPPPVPRLFGMDAKSWFQSDQELVFQSQSDSIFQYRIDSWPSDDTATLPPFRNWEPGIYIFGGGGSGVRDVILEARSVDAAGNASPSFRRVLHLESQTAYVDSSGGKAGGDGTRDAPVDTIGRALILLGSKGGTIRLAQGNHALGSVLALQVPLILEGGYDSSTWQKVEEGRTVLYPGPRFSGTSLINIQNADVTMKNLYVSDASQGLQTLVHATEAIFRLDTSQLAVTATISALISKNSQVTMQESLASTSDPRQVVLLDMDNCTLEMKDSRLECTRLPDALLRNRDTSRQTLIRGSGGTMHLGGSEFVLGGGAEATGFDLSGTHLQASDIDVSVIRKARYLNYFRARESSRLELSDIRFHQEQAPVSAVAFRLDDSLLQAKKMDLIMGATQSASAFQARNTDMQLSGVRVEMEGGSEFLSFAGLEKTRFNADSLRVLLSGTGSESWMMSARSCVVMMEGSSFSLRTSSSVSAFQFWGAGTGVLKNNILEGNPASGLLVMDGEASEGLEIRDNLMDDWGTILVLEGKTGRKVFRNSRELEDQPVGGVRFSGNRIRQGL